jgi:hypothetical protein
MRMMRLSERGLGVCDHGDSTPDRAPEAESEQSPLTVRWPSG